MAFGLMGFGFEVGWFLLCDTYANLFPHPPVSLSSSDVGVIEESIASMPLLDICSGNLLGPSQRPPARAAPGLCELNCSSVLFLALLFSSFLFLFRPETV